MKNKNSDFLFFLICGGALISYIGYKIKQKKDSFGDDLWDWF